MSQKIFNSQNRIAATASVFGLGNLYYICYPHPGFRLLPPYPYSAIEDVAAIKILIV